MAKKKRRRKRRPLWQDILFLLGFFVGAVVYLYPDISDSWNYYRDQQLIASYSEAVEAMDPETFDKEWADARAYNEQHTVNVIADAFEDEDYILTHPYDTLLNPAGNMVMGYIDIPKINIQLSIYHGVGKEALEKGVGHIEGTSLPIGGLNTHAVLSAHRGLPSALLFTDLDQLGEGDRFFITVLNEKLAYEVDQINVVLPDDPEVQNLIALEEDKDLITLITCTPYGVNTHRLLVRGHRVAMEEAAETTEITDDNSAESAEAYRAELNRIRLIKIVGMGGFFILVFLIWIITRLTRKR
ncbi:MAG: class C sortase [Clostridiales bacterium]|nr:class C sortase [Candidatus Blautia equi]